MRVSGAVVRASGSRQAPAPFQRETGEPILRIHDFDAGFTWWPVEGPFRRVTERQARDLNDLGFFLFEDARPR